MTKPNRSNLPCAPLGLVVWRPEIQSPPEDCSIAIVTRPGSIIDVTIMPLGSKVGNTRESVRHVNDPENAKPRIHSSGFWDFTDETKALHRQRAELANVLAALSARPSSKVRSRVLEASGSMVEPNQGGEGTQEENLWDSSVGDNELL